jgi:hypothetical protein
MDLQEKGRGSWTGFNVAEDMGRWRALVNAVLKLGFHKMRGIFLPAVNRLASEEELCFME